MAELRTNFYESLCGMIGMKKWAGETREVSR